MAKNDTAHQNLWKEAQAAGQKAAEEKMVELRRAGAQWFVKDGQGKIVDTLHDLCGFAYTKITPATSSFARWLIKNCIGFKEYRGGVAISAHPVINGTWVQSVQVNMAYAEGVARVFENAGISRVYAYSRLD